MSAWSSSLEELSGNRRLQLGGLAIVALLWTYGLLTLDEQVDARQQAAASLQNENRALANLADDDAWLELRQAAVRRLSEFRERIWREESEGHVQAAFQDWLQGQVNARGLRALELNVSILSRAPGEVAGATTAQLALPPEMRLARARLVLDFEPQALIDLLAGLAQDGRWIWTERVMIRNWGTPRVELELGALFIVGAKDRT